MLNFIEADESKSRNEFLKHKAKRSFEAKSTDERQLKAYKK